MSYPLNLKSERAKRARLARQFKGSGPVLSGGGLLLLAGGVTCWAFLDLARLGYAVSALACALLVLGLWQRYNLSDLAANKQMTSLDDILEPQLLALMKPTMHARLLWDIVNQLPEGRFVSSRLLLHRQYVGNALSNNPEDSLDPVWQEALNLMTTLSRNELHGGMVAAALLLHEPALQPLMDAAKLRREDIIESLSWLDRQLGYIHTPRLHFGGIGRDWASGFTPHLEHFGDNISQALERSGGAIQFNPHASLLPGLAGSLAQGNGIALVGPEGVGKSALIGALATYLLEGREQRLQYHQIISLNASLIMAGNTAQLEQTILTLMGEVVAAGNIILFLDDAHLFFGSGVGAFDMGQVLLPILRGRNVRIIAAFTPAEWQELQAKHSALATSLSVTTVSEPSVADSMRVIEDEALVLEHQTGSFMTYEAIREAFRLSGQFMQEQSYPSKAIRLLEQSLPYASTSLLVDASTIQQALEKSKGVKVSGAAAPEATMLLNLEDRIHERMINQKRAVGVVASALRRGRAGVTNPKRPLGSFLFLGPTGVGKTELARSLAATYFGDEHQMIRLDMSEYQQPSDVARLLATGGQTTQSLLLAIRQQPFAVVLLDEIEKAHPNVLNLLLQLLDEGQLTDEQGHPASFRSSIIIATSNAGAADIAQQVQQGKDLASFERPLLDKLIAAGQFKPELLNRFDEVVLFRPLTEAELAQVAGVMLREVNRTLEPQHISVQLTEAALANIVHAGYDPEFGARPMRRIIQKTVENAVAVKILEGSAQAGAVIILDVQDVTTQKTDE